MRTLVALPVYNEAMHVDRVLDEVGRYAENVLVVDDGSTDGTGEILSRRLGINGTRVVSHSTNYGYGAALHTAFDYAASHQFDVLVTIDCDGQHQPHRIPLFVDAVNNCDVVSGSRYLHRFNEDTAPPEDRMRVNRIITTELKERLRLHLTDSFCGFKAYRVDAIKNLSLVEPGYAMPLEFWVEAVAAGLRVREMPVPLIYLEEERSFGGSLDHTDTRLQHYRDVLDRSVRRVQVRGEVSSNSLGV